MIINAKFNDNPDQQGLESILTFAHEPKPVFRKQMLEARNHSLYRIQRDFCNFIFWSYSFNKYQSKTLGIFSDVYSVKSIYNVFKAMESRTIDNSNLLTLVDWLNGQHSTFDFWWDTQCDFMCWKEEEDVYKIEDWNKLVFETKFKKVIKFKG